MRSFAYPQLLPPTLRSTGKGAIQQALNETNFARDPKALAFPSHWNESDVRGCLYATQGRVCAYCGCYLPRNDRGDVEHYRPKQASSGQPPNGGYWWLAYNLENYTLSCNPCNRIHKRNRFPLFHEQARVNYTTRSQIHAESPILAHPALVKLEDLLTLDAPTARLLPRPALSPSDDERIRQIADFFAWNTDARLILERRQCIQQVLAALAANQLEQVRLMASRFAPHGLTVLLLLQQLNRSDLIPPPELEIQALTLEILEELKLNQQNRQRTALKENLWTLRFLWESSPPLHPWFTTVFQAQGCFSQVMALAL